MSARRRALDDGVDVLGRRDVVVGRERLLDPVSMTSNSSIRSSGAGSRHSGRTWATLVSSQGQSRPAGRSGPAAARCAAAAARPRPARRRGAPDQQRHAACPGPACAGASVTRRRTPTRAVARAVGKTAAAQLAEQGEPPGVREEVVGALAPRATTMIRSVGRSGPPASVSRWACDVEPGQRVAAGEPVQVAERGVGPAVDECLALVERRLALDDGVGWSTGAPPGPPWRRPLARPGRGRPPDTARRRPRTGSRVPPLPTPTRGALLPGGGRLCTRAGRRGP